MTVLKRLDVYWKEANPSIKQKKIVYDAVIRSKLLYGLESASLNETIKRSLDTFQMKGVRKILKRKTTYVDREQTDRKLIEDIQDEIIKETEYGRDEK